MKLSDQRAQVSHLPLRDGDGYSWGGEAILSIGNKAIMLGAGKDGFELAQEIARRWNAGRAALEGSEK